MIKKEMLKRMKNKVHNNIKRILIMVCIVLACLIIYEIIHIYALFHSEVSGVVQMENGVWKIIVNGTEISTGVETNFTINTTSIENNSHVKPGNLAPGLSGSFQIQISPENTDVSVKYDITLNQDSLTNENIVIKSIEEIEEHNTLIRTGENTYTGIIPLQDIKNGVTNTIKMEIEWQDNESYNAQDTQLGVVEGSQLQIPITVKAIQYIGEQIIPYVEE